MHLSQFRPTSPALAFDLGLIAIVIAFGLLFDHVVQSPPSKPLPQYAQSASAQAAVQQAPRLASPPVKRPS